MEFARVDESIEVNEEVLLTDLRFAAGFANVGSMVGIATASSFRRADLEETAEWLSAFELFAASLLAIRIVSNQLSFTRSDGDISTK